MTRRGNASNSPVGWSGAMNRWVFFPGFFVVFLLWSNVWALPEDATQHIEVRATQVVIDERSGVSTYSGGARVVQGSLVLSAERIVLHSRARKLHKVVAYGTASRRARYKQNQPNQVRFVEATAQTIVYLVGKNFVHLKGRARLTQGFDAFSGEQIDYDIAQDKVIAKRSDDGVRRVRFKIKL